MSKEFDNHAKRWRNVCCARWMMMMVEAKKSRRIVCLIAFLSAASGVATGQHDRDDPRKELATDGVAVLPTLAELKSAGALRSSYRKHDRRPVNSEAPEADLAAFRKDIQPVLSKACVRCHGPETQEASLRIDTLDPDLLHGSDVKWWLEVVSVLSNGEMPPADEPRLAADELGKMIAWLSSQIQVASTVRRAARGHTSFRRMTRYEHNYVLQDLLGLPYDFARNLPPESTSEDGFKNSSEMLHLSGTQLAHYRKLSRSALQQAALPSERPAPVFWGVSMEAAAAKLWAKYDEDREKVRQRNQDDPEKLERALARHDDKYRVKPRSTHFRNPTTELATRASWNYRRASYAWKPAHTRPEVPPVSGHVAVIPPGQRLIIELGNAVADAGTLRVRVRAAGTSVEEDRIPSLQLEFGWQASNNSSASVRISDRDIAIDAPLDKPQFYQWDIPLSEVYPRNAVRKTAKMGDTPSPSEYVKFVNSSISQGDIHIDYVEIAAPVYEQWPPPSHTRIFTASKNKPDETIYAREVLTNFMSRAWRRPVTDSEVDQKLALFKKLRPECDDFQEAMIEVLATVLSSPKFLYLVETGPQGRQTERLNDYELATRLSMCLWCSTPDEELLALASKGRLGDRYVLLGQVKRMLADARSRRFSKHFVRGWLGMQLLDFLDVDRKTYPQFDRSLKEAMQQEPLAFFHEVLQNNHSLLDFIHADYTMANERLAEHYGLNGVYGNHFRRVRLDPQHNRGGLLTQAGLLAMNSDGKDSHPLKRGIWMLESLLNDPPPPPPPAVPEIDLADPEIAKLTLKQRIEDHRNDAACLSCHAKIDPWGIAFENFDAVGNWRTHIQGEPVDASSLLFNRQKLDGMDGLKRFLLEHRQDQFARAMVHKLATYALGRPLTFGDRSSVDKITAELRKQDDGLATMVGLIVTSELFRSK